MLSNQSIYASLCSSTWSHLLCSKLCQHNPPTPNLHTGCYWNHDNEVRQQAVIKYRGCCKLVVHLQNKLNEQCSKLALLSNNANILHCWQLHYFHYRKHKRTIVTSFLIRKAMPSSVLQTPIASGAILCTHAHHKAMHGMSSLIQSEEAE